MQSQTQANRWVIALLIIGVIAISIPAAGADGSPSSLTPCKLHDPNNGACLRDLWQNILISGIRDVPGLKWISIDPYKVKKVRVAVDTGLVRVNMELTKVEITGLVQGKILDASVTNGEMFQLTVKVPKMHIKGNYALNGQALVLNLDGKGPFEMDLTDLEIVLSSKAKGVEEDGEYYFKPMSLKTNVQHIGNIHVQFHHLFGNNQVLTDSANEVFNQNWNDLIELMRPVIAEAMDMSLLGQAKKYLDSLPARVIFSDVP